jgi:hypothetical protein
MEMEMAFTADMEDWQKLRTIFRRCCTDREWKYLMSCANFSRVFMEMETVEEFQAVCEAAANLLNIANIPGRTANTEHRLLECQEKLRAELALEGLR